MVTLEDAKDVTDLLVKKIRPFSVLLFGSVAREGIGTDLDLLVITDEKSVIKGDFNLLLHKCLKRFYRKFAIDPFIVPLPLIMEYYSKGSPFLRMLAKEGRSLYMRDAAGEWLKQAEEELAMAEYLLQGKYSKGACYHAQQSIEKAIKTRLLKKGWELEKTHSIERLIIIGKDYKTSFSLSDEEIVFIESIYRSRYPVEAGLLPLGEPSEADAGRAVSIAKRIFKEAQTAFKK